MIALNVGNIFHTGSSQMLLLCQDFVEPSCCVCELLALLLGAGVPGGFAILPGSTRTHPQCSIEQPRGNG